MLSYKTTNIQAIKNSCVAQWYRTAVFDRRTFPALQCRIWGGGSLQGRHGPGPPANAGPPTKQHFESEGIQDGHPGN